jgi:lipopolysaccharide export system protein LptA
MERNPYFARFTRASIALAIVVGAYCAYAYAAVPYIEPPLIVKKISTATAEERERARNIHLPYLKLFAAYFPADHWVHHNPKVLVNDSAMLLIKDYNPLPDGQVELNPCIMIFFPQERNGEQPQRQALILEAPDGAVLQFADGFDLAQAKIGRLTHGHLRGEVTIRSDMKDAGPQDDLLVRTREIQLNEDRIWTDHDVQFRVGENHGHGTQMEIRLLASERASSTTAMNVAGVQSMELSRNVKMNLAMGNAGLLPGEPGKKPVAPTNPADPGPPVEITCRGPFHFDLVRHVATFEEHVDVLRFNPTGSSDQLTCETLAIHFLPGTKPDAAGTGKDKPDKKKPDEKKSDAPKGLQPLRPKMLEARGEPVIVRSPSTGGQARCERLRYDIETRTIALESPEEVILFQGTNEIHAPALQYQPSETPGGLGMVWASGPGWLRAAAEKDPSRIFEARWKQELHLRKHEGEQVISLRGRPELGMVGMGRMLADEVHLWLKEVEADPNAPAPEKETSSAAQKKQKIEPDRLLAAGNVQIDSASLTAATERMEAWFKQLGPEAFATNEEAQPAPTVPKKNPQNQGDDIFTTADGTARSKPNAAESANPNEATELTAVKQKPKYNLQGKLIRLQVAMVGQKAEVTDATVSGRVALRETQTALPTEKPLLITGEKLQLSQANLPQSYVSVTGQPATVVARGLTMQGGQIQLDRGKNRLWIDGPGKMLMPAKQNLRGEATPNEQMLTIDWQGSMNFNGLVVEFQQDVVGRGESQLLRTGKLKAEIMERVDFSATTKPADTQLRRITCEEGVYFENQTVEAGVRTSFEQMATRDMTIDQTTGDLFANGPGWLNTVRRGGAGGDNPLAGGAFGPGAVAKPISTPLATAAPAGNEPLTFLRVDFRHAMEGNTIRKEINFTGEARAIYGPVADWDAKLDPDDPRGLGERDVLLNTDRLKVVEMPTQRNGRNTMELEAIGNTLVEGQTFTARADRMAYTQAKELLVLEGTAKTDAQLWRQAYVGAPASHAAARKILYWKDTNRVEVNDARFFGGQFGGEKK